MNEKPHIALLDRAVTVSQVEEHLSEEIAFLEDIVNYGTNLVIRTLKPNAENLTNLVVNGTLLKHVVGMFDASVELLKVGHSTSALLQARSAFEAALYIQLILKSSSDFRAKTYIVGEYRKKREYALGVLDSKSSPGTFNKKYSSIGFTTEDIPTALKEMLREQVCEIDRLLSGENFAEVNAKYQSARGRKVHDVEWYKCLGFTSFYAVAKDLDQSASYSIFYDQGSSVMHADSLSRQVFVQQGRAALKPIRHLEDASLLVSAIGQTALRTYRIILTYCRPLELPAFELKYTSDWRRYILSSKQFSYDYRSVQKIDGRRL